MGMLIANWKKKLKESYESVVETKSDESTKSDENTEATEKPKRGRKKKEEN